MNGRIITETLALQLAFVWLPVHVQNVQLGPKWDLCALRFLICVFGFPRDISSIELLLTIIYNKLKCQPDYNEFV